MDGHIVVIDDEPDVLEVLCEALELEGFSVVCLDRPQKVASLGEDVEPSLFLIDIMLPGISGIELAQQLRVERFRDTPMIAMSASSLMVHTAEATGLFQETISKPFELDEVLGTVERYVA
jgi:DNA-binding response OmpR family regulator